MMDLDKVEHILRAAGEATGHREFVLIGSAAIFVWRSVVPETMAMSREADMFADVADPQEAERIGDELDGFLGQASQFDDTYGYYCDGVSPETPILPTDWRDRAKTYSSVNTNGVTAIAPEPNDLALSKLSAGRPKDIDWLVAATRADIIDIETMSGRLHSMPVERVLGGMDALKERLVVVGRRALEEGGD